MAKVQVIMPVTMNGFLPNESEELMQWIRTDKQGFSYWEKEATFNIYPHYTIMDMMAAKQRHNEDCTYFMKIDTLNSAEYSQRLFLFHIVDEIIIYLLPVSYDEGLNIYHNITSDKWKLHQAKTFRNNICRLIYKKNNSSSLF